MGMYKLYKSNYLAWQIIWTTTRQNKRCFVVKMLKTFTHLLPILWMKTKGKSLYETNFYWKQITHLKWRTQCNACFILPNTILQRVTITCIRHFQEYIQFGIQFKRVLCSSNYTTEVNYSLIKALGIYWKEKKIFLGAMVRNFVFTS